MKNITFCAVLDFRNFDCILKISLSLFINVIEHYNLVPVNIFLNARSRNTGLKYTSIVI